MASTGILSLTEFTPQGRMSIPVADPEAGSGLKNGRVTIDDLQTMLGGVAAGAIISTPQVIEQSQTLAANTNFLAIGPVSVAEGTSTTVPAGSSGTVYAPDTPISDISGLTALAAGASVPQKISEFRGRFAYLYDYGAKGDGVTDDSAAYNEAAATGKPVFIEPGSYKLGAALNQSTGALTVGFGPIDLPGYGLPSTTNQVYWMGNGGLYLSQNFTQPNAQATLVINAQFDQPPGTTGESSAAYIGVIFNNANSDCVGLTIQGSAGPGNQAAAICTLNTYVIYGAGTQGHGSAQEVDVDNNSGTDDPWPINNSFAKGGILYVGQGTNKGTYYLRFSASGAPSQAGLTFDQGACALYDMVGTGSGLGTAATNRWSVDVSGNAVFNSVTIGAGGPQDLVGSGAPTLAAPIASTYRNKTGAAGSVFYVNRTGLSNGWFALA